MKSHHSSNMHHQSTFQMFVLHTYFLEVLEEIYSYRLFGHKMILQALVVLQLLVRLDLVVLVDLVDLDLLDLEVPLLRLDLVVLEVRLIRLNLVVLVVLLPLDLVVLVVLLVLLVLVDQQVRLRLEGLQVL